MNNRLFCFSFKTWHCIFFVDDPYSSTAKLNHCLQHECKQPVRHWNTKVDHEQKQVNNNNIGGSDQANNNNTMLSKTRVESVCEPQQPKLSDKITPPVHLAEVEKLLSSLKQSYAYLTSLDPNNESSLSKAPHQTVMGHPQAARHHFPPATSTVNIPPYIPISPRPTTQQTMPRTPVGSIQPAGAGQQQVTPGAAAYTPGLSSINSSSISNGHLPKTPRDSPHKMASTPKKPEHELAYYPVPDQVMSDGDEWGRSTQPNTLAMRRATRRQDHNNTVRDILNHKDDPNFESWFSRNPSDILPGSVPMYKDMPIYGFPSSVSNAYAQNGVPNRFASTYDAVINGGPVTTSGNLAGLPMCNDMPINGFHSSVSTANRQNEAPTLFGSTYGIVTNGAPITSSGTLDLAGRQQRYEEFMKSLMKDIECVTPKGVDNSLHVSLPPKDTKETSDENGKP